MAEQSQQNQQGQSQQGQNQQTQTSSASPPVENGENLKPATLEELRAMASKGKEVRVLMPENVTSVNIDGTPKDVDEDGVVKLGIKHALHAMEAFGGRILSDLETKVEAGARKLLGRK